LDLAEDKLDFSVNFHFEANEFFEGTILKKTFLYDPELFEPNKANATVVQWKEGKNPTIKIKTKKIKKGKTMEVQKTETKVESFFDIFVEEEQGVDIIGELVAQSEYFRDDLIRNSFEFFLDINPKEDYGEDEESSEEEEKCNPKKNCKKKCCK